MGKRPICKTCGKKIIAPMSKLQEHCSNCWKLNAEKNNKSPMVSIKLDEEGNMEGKKTKTQIKEEHAEAVINLLKERSVADEDMSKVFSCAYNKVKLKK